MHKSVYPLVGLSPTETPAEQRQLAKRDEETLQKEEWAREAQEQKEEHAMVAQEMRDAVLREEMAKQSEEQRAQEAQRQRQHFLAQNLPKYDGHE